MRLPTRCLIPGTLMGHPCPPNGGMRYGPETDHAMKSEEQQAGAIVFRVRDFMVRQRLRSLMRYAVILLSSGWWPHRVSSM